MSKFGNYIFLCFLFIAIASCGQTKTSLPESFINLLNDYKKDSLALITSDEFQLKENYVKLSENKAEFLDTFVTFSKAVEGKFAILKTLSNGEPTIFLVKDISVYSKYFSGGSLTWKMTISTKNGKIDQVTSDTTLGYKAYMDRFMIQHDDFLKWLSAKYPNETENSLCHNMDDLFAERLKEYSTAKQTD